MSSDRPVLLTVRVLLWRGRGLLLVLGAVVAGAVVLRTLAPAPPVSTPVVVAARDVVPGTALTASDVRVRHWPVILLPAGTAQRADDVLGREPLVPLPAGAAVLDVQLAGERFAAAVPDGAVVVPVRLADPAVVALLRPGDRVDLVRPLQAGPPEVVARRALVVQADAGAAAGLLDLGGAEQSLVVVAVDADEGRALAAAGAWGEVGAVIVD